MLDQNCPYFEAGSVAFKRPGGQPPLMVPYHRCHLAEEMLSRLEKTEEGTVIASALSIAPDGADPRSIYGPDLDIPTPETCTPERGRQRCEPGFVKILSDQGLDTTLPPNG